MARPCSIPGRDCIDLYVTACSRGARREIGTNNVVTSTRGSRPRIVSFSHLLASTGAEEHSGVATERLLEHSVALRVTAESSLLGSGQEPCSVVDQVDEVEQPQPRAVSSQCQTDVLSKMAAHFADVPPDNLREFASPQIRPREHDFQSSARQGVSIICSPTHAMSFTPKGAYLPLDVGIGHRARCRTHGSEPTELLPIESESPCSDIYTERNIPQYSLGKGRGETDQIEVEVRRRLEQHVILPG